VSADSVPSPDLIEGRSAREQPQKDVRPSMFNHLVQRARSVTHSECNTCSSIKTKMGNASTIMERGYQNAQFQVRGTADTRKQTGLLCPLARLQILSWVHGNPCMLPTTRR